MKKLITPFNTLRLFILLIFILLLDFSVFSQPWTNSFPKDREAKSKLTLTDYQKAFYDYWAPYNVKDGYYFENGEKQKARGWIQFKRWEWFWESRVNPKTTAFSETSSYEQFKKYTKQRGVTDNPAGNWTCIGPFNTTSTSWNDVGRLNYIAFNPDDDDIFYVSAASGGVWKTTDGGTNWNSLGDENEALGASNIAIVTTSGDDILYLATGDSDGINTYSVGVLKSTNGGTTWNTTGLEWIQGQQYLIYRLMVDPSNTNILYAATNDGLYKTTNAAGSWTQISTINFEDLEFKPGNSAIIYGSTDYGEIYRSTDSGNNWSLILSEPLGRRTMLAVSDNNSSRVYAVMADENNRALFGVYKSTNSGAAYSMVLSGSTLNILGAWYNGQSTGGQAWFDLAITADPANADIFFVGGIHTWKSTDAGANWEVISGSYTHPDKHYIEIQNGSSTIFECNDGGLIKSIDGGATWTDLTHMAIGQMYRLGVAQTVSNEAIAGHQDNGTKNYSSGIWTNVVHNDGLECIIDFTNADIQYGSYQGLNIYRTYDHWTTKTKITDAIPGSNLFLTPYKMDPNNHLTLFVANQNLWKSTNQGDDWVQLTNWDGNFIREFAIAPSNSQTMYLVSFYNVYKTTDGGTTWTTITGTLPIGDSRLVNVAIKDDDPNTAWVTFNGYDSDGVYETTNGGTSWTNISEGLPELPINCVIQNKQNTSEVEIYAGTDVGIYLRRGDDDWEPFFDGLPNVVVNELDIYYDENNSVNSKMRAATFGRSMWESDLWSPPPAPVANFEADNITPTTLEEVQFTDLSTNNPESWVWEITPSTFSFVDGTGENSQNPVCVFNEPGLYTVSLTATNDGGSNTETKNDYINVSQAAPEADFDADNLTPTTIENVQFTDLSANSPTTWLWEITPSTFSFVDGTDENSQNPICQFNEAGFYTVSLTATNIGGSNTETKNDYINVSQAAPEADFEADNTEPAVNMNVIFTDLSDNNPTSWLWEFTPSTVSFTSGTNENSQNPTVKFNAVDLYTVSLTATNDGGNDTEIKTDYINVTEGLSVTASANPDELCLGESSQLNSIAGGGTGNYTYSWTSDPPGFYSNIQNPVVSPLETTTYSIEIDDGEDLATEDVMVTVNPFPEITLGDWPETLCNQQEPPVQLTAEPEGGIYSGNSVTEDGMFSPETAPLGENVITYTYQDENGCENSEQNSIFVDECVGIEQTTINNSINIYPNPNSGNFTVNSKQTITKIEIVNQLGKLVFESKFNSKSIEIDTKLQKGLYFIRIKLDDKILIIKEIIIR